MEILEAITGRKSIRAFLDQPVSEQIISEILETARWAPSGVNSQPWQVAVITGATKQLIGDRIIQAREQGIDENPDYDYYPKRWTEPYKSRRKHCGLTMYSTLGISREDTEKQKASWYRNYRFFDAPVGLIFLVDKHLGKGSWVDMGLFIQNVMLAARHYNLETCPQASLAEYPDIIREILEVADANQIVCGMSMGYPDMSHPVNSYRLEREPVEIFTRWYK